MIINLDVKNLYYEKLSNFLMLQFYLFTIKH